MHTRVTAPLPRLVAPAMRSLLSSVPISSAPAVPFYFNDYVHVELPKTNSFPMQKYRYVRQALERELTPRALATFHQSPFASVEDLCTVHADAYVGRFLNNKLSRDENRRIGFPWSPASVNRALSSTGGTVAATHAVCRPGAAARFAGHIAGGTHRRLPPRMRCAAQVQPHALLATLPVERTMRSPIAARGTVCSTILRLQRPSPCGIIRIFGAC